MLTESEALARILEQVHPLPTEEVPLLESLGRFSAEDLRAHIPLPVFDNSAMDGYAVRAHEAIAGAVLKLAEQQQAAGLSHSLVLKSGHAIRIFTGAPVPVGADAVIMQEDVKSTPNELEITCLDAITIGENIRRSGCDLCVGQLMLRKGECITPARMGALASQGWSRLRVGGAPRIAIVTTGDELIAPGQELATGQIYNSNQPMLYGLVTQLGTRHVTLHHVRDNLRETTQALDHLRQTHDFIILTGGVSVGDHDFVKPALQHLGILPSLWRVKIKPGKPLLFCSSSVYNKHTCSIFGLPGNPVSSFVTFYVFVRPAILRAMGAHEEACSLPKVTACLSSELRNKGDRPHYVRGTLHEGTFTPTGVQQSHALYGLSQANALLRMEPEDQLSRGDTVSALLCH